MDKVVSKRPGSKFIHVTDSCFRSKNSVTIRGVDRLNTFLVLLDRYITIIVVFIALSSDWGNRILFKIGLQALGGAGHPVGEC